MVVNIILSDKAKEAKAVENVNPKKMPCNLSSLFFTMKLFHVVASGKVGQHPRIRIMWDSKHPLPSPGGTLVFIIVSYSSEQMV